MKSILDRVIAAKLGWQPTMQVLHGLQDLFSLAFLSDPMLARVLPRSLIDWYGTHEGQWFHDVVAADVAKMDARALRPNFSVPIARDAAATRYLAEHGGRLLFGTDTPSAPTYANPPGLNGWFEIQRLAAAGMTPAQIFRAATLSNAQAFHLDGEIGTVQVGKRANLLLLRHDPVCRRCCAGFKRPVLARLLPDGAPVTNGMDPSSRLTASSARLELWSPVAE
jgi:hypothetical protein